MRRALFALILLALSALPSFGQYIRVTAHQVYTQTSSRGQSAWDAPQIPTTGRIEAELTVYLPNLTSAKTSGYRGLTYGFGEWRRGNGASLRIGKQRYKPLTVQANGLLMEGSFGFGEKANAPDGVFTLGSIETPLQEIGAPLVPLLTLSGMVLQTIAPYWGTAGPLVPHLELQAEQGDHSGWLDVGTFGVERHGDLSTAHYKLDKIIIDAGTPDIPLHDLVADKTPAQFGGPPETHLGLGSEPNRVTSGAQQIATACAQEMQNALKLAGNAVLISRLIQLYEAGDIVAFGVESAGLERAAISGVAAGAIICTGAQLASGLPGIVTKNTQHGEDQLNDRGFSDDDIALTKTGKQFIQADGATVYLKETRPGKFNMLVVGTRGVITGLKNISQKSVDKLARNYGWK